MIGPPFLAEGRPFLFVRVVRSVALRFIRLFRVGVCVRIRMGMVGIGQLDIELHGTESRIGLLFHEERACQEL